jgi:hypothetical protein
MFIIISPYLCPRSLKCFSKIFELILQQSSIRTKHLFNRMFSLVVYSDTSISCSKVVWPQGLNYYLLARAPGFAPGSLVRSVLLIFLVFCVLFSVLFVFVLCLVYQLLSVSLGCLLDCPILFSLTFIDVKVSLNQFAKNHITNMEHEEVF